VTIKAKDGNKQEAFVYTLDYTGEKLKEFKRVVNDLDKVLVNAKKVRQQVIEKFPKAFSNK
jgi:peroxiredoxin